MARRKPRAFDTVIYRSGDQIGAWSYALLSGLGLSLTGIALAAVPLSVVWLLNSFWLSGEQDKDEGCAKAPIRCACLRAADRNVESRDDTRAFASRTDGSPTLTSHSLS